MPKIIESLPVHFHSFRPLSGISRFVKAVLVLAGLWLVLGSPLYAQSESNPSGLPLPRFASTRSEPVNVRVGPGTQYKIAFTYVREGQPVEIIQEFDTWRKIRDVDGDEGWVHQNLLSGDRHGIITPLAAGGQTALRSRTDRQAGVRAWLGAGFQVLIEGCEKDWCAVKASTGDKGARTYSGFVPQAELWGIYPNEQFD